MRVFTTLPQEDLRKVGPAAQAIEADGYTGVSTQENRHDPFLALAVAGVATEQDRAAHRRRDLLPALADGGGQCRLGSRRPAPAAASRSGLGSQIRPHNERRFSVPWTAPAPRMREYIQAVRAIWAAWKGDGKLDYEGKHYRFTLMTPNFVPEPYDAPAPRIGLAAVGPAMLKVAAEEMRRRPSSMASAPRKYLENRDHADHHRGPRQGRAAAREAFEISGGGFLVTGKDDAAVAEAVRLGALSRGVLRLDAGLLAGVRGARAGRSRPQAQRHDQGRPVGRDRGEVPDDVVHLFAAVGRHDQIAKAIEERFGGLVDSISASANSAKPADLPPDLIQDIARIPTRYRAAA